VSTLSRRLCGAGAFALSVFCASPAFSAPRRLELAPTIGYTATFTTGLSPYGAFVGLGLHENPWARVWLGGALHSYLGSSAAGDGPQISYRARDRAYGLACSAAWRFGTQRWSIEPGAEFGANWILGGTYVTPMRLRDRYLAGNVGPLLRLGLHLGSFGLGVEGAALYVPSYIAAPLLRVGAVALLPI
jgi:hypothetical protein